MFVKRVKQRVARILGYEHHAYGNLSYSQCGEDLIINSYLKMMGITQPVYLELGANHPLWLSNSYYFHRLGCTGICVDPNPQLAPLYRKYRAPLTKFLPIGVGTEAGEFDFFIMSADVLSTTNPAEAEKLSTHSSHTIDKVIKVQMKTIATIISENLSCIPDFISLDTESDDLAILKTIDFASCRPKIFCIETIEYAEDDSGSKLVDILDFMAMQDYHAVADTWINTIFVDRRAWTRSALPRLK